MKQYYIHHNGTQLGPFNVEQIREQRIGHSTMVWYEGLTAWIPASEVADMATVFSTPPPLQVQPVTASGPTPPPYNVDNSYTPQPEQESYTSSKILGLEKSTFYIAAGIAVFLLGLVWYRSYSSHVAIQQMEQVTNAEQSEQLQQQQAQIDAQNAALEAQREEQRKERERQAAKERQERIDKLNGQYFMTSENLHNAQVQLQDVSGFKLLRSAQERQNQIDVAMRNVNIYQNQLNEITSELQQLGANVPQ